MAKKSPAILTPVDRLQQHLPKYCFWDEVEQVLYIDARKIFPKEGVVTILGWDNMMLNAEPIPEYPAYFKIMLWAKHSQFADWKKQIPAWVQDSCALFPSHQMQLLHYAGKYPQILELLDHAPMLAWRLVTSGMEEPEIVALMSGKRTQIAESVGWPGKADTVKFLTNLRLRWVDKNIAEQIEVCLLDEQRLTALQDLPRINSMALTLAARFPELIGSTLHHALAQLPCRPMQCQSMVSLLEDAYALAAYLQLAQEQVDRIGQCRYLVEVTKLYLTWMDTVFSSQTEVLQPTDAFQSSLKEQPQLVIVEDDWLRLAKIQQHAWFIDYAGHENHKQLYVWEDEEGVWAALLHAHLPDNPQLSKQVEQLYSIERVRGLENRLPGAKQLSTLHLWQAQQLKQGD